MFDKKYRQGMKDGAKPFKDIDSKTAKEVRETADKMHAEQQQMLGVIKDVIDFQNMTEDEKEIFIKRLDEIQKKARKPVNYRIRIVWSEEKDKEIAENLCKELKLQHDRTNCVSYKQYLDGAEDVADYTIFMQDPARIAEYPDSKVLYEDEYGCKIIRHEGKIALLCSSINGDDNNVREKLSKYYNCLREQSHMETGKQDAKADRTIKNRKNINSSGFLNGYTGILNKVADKFTNTLDNMEDGLADIQDSMEEDFSDDNPLKKVRGILKVPVLFGSAVGGVAAAVVMGGGILLMGAPSLLPEKLSNAQMDDKVIPVAQRRILATKVYELIQNETIMETTEK